MITHKERDTFELYNHPEIYDIAFSWDLSEEVRFFRRVFETHLPFPVNHILEPACGTGRMLRALAGAGIQVTGYDANPSMAQYAKDSIAADGTDFRVMLAEMSSAGIPGLFDAAVNSINSIGYLHSDDEIVSHLRATGSSLREKGVYIVHLNFAHSGDLPDGDHWTLERGGIRVNTSWRILNEDRETRLCHQVCTIVVEQNGKTDRYEESHTLRLWLFSDLVKLAHKSEEFEVAAIYGEDFVEIEDKEHVSGEHGNVYVILRKV
ncbi:MAG: class I SAM-dependent methyltransferase [Gemmatimonadota bacterium]|nr:class I SAM-dependent methyltransferase [Gemmatimonadota bacterium]